MFEWISNFWRPKAQSQVLKDSTGDGTRPEQLDYSFSVEEWEQQNRLQDWDREVQWRREYQAQPRYKIWELADLTTSANAERRLPEEEVDVDGRGRLWFWCVNPAFGGTPIQIGLLYPRPLLNLAFDVVASAQLFRICKFEIPSYFDGGDVGFVYRAELTRSNLLALLAGHLACWSVEAREAAASYSIATAEILAVREQMAIARLIPGVHPIYQPRFPPSFFELGPIEVPPGDWDSQGTESDLGAADYPSRILTQIFAHPW